MQVRSRTIHVKTKKEKKKYDPIEVGRGDETRPLELGESGAG